MKKKLFVGGLNWDTDDAGLKKAFAEYGDVTEATVITERGTNRSRGFGFVKFATEDGAKDAIQAMNGAELDGRTLRVDEAHDRRSGGGRSSGGGGGSRGGRW